MKKIFIAMAVFFGYATVTFAQTNFIATLQHEGEFSHFYGAGALTSAYNAAQAGDIITLSPGTFSTPGTINKSITLRGAGVEATEKTFISGTTTFISTDETMSTTVEGIKFNESTYIQNNSTGTGQGTIKFIKNTFNGLSATVAGTYSTEKGPAVKLYNCAVYGMYFRSNSYPAMMLYNCYVEDPGWGTESSSQTTTTFVNCVIRWKSSYYTSGHSYNSYQGSSYYLNYYNCIFNTAYEAFAANSANKYPLPNTATCYNCLSVNDGSLFKNIVSGDSNKAVNSSVDVFVTYRNDHNVGESFNLTDAARETYIGTDGTQIGMQGGNYPYNTTPQYPIVTKFNADPQTNKAGVLNVEIEVDGK